MQTRGNNPCRDKRSIFNFRLQAYQIVKISFTFVFNISSVKWGHLGHFDPTPINAISPTNSMGSSGPL